MFMGCVAMPSPFIQTGFWQRAFAFSSDARMTHEEPSALAQQSYIFKGVAIYLGSRTLSSVKDLRKTAFSLICPYVEDLTRIRARSSSVVPNFSKCPRAYIA